VRIEARRADHPDRSTTGKDKPEKEGQQSSTRLDRTGLLIEGTFSRGRLLLSLNQ
jgi:hypothetical protein